MTDLNKHPDPDNEIYRYLSTDLIRAAIPYGSNVLDCGAGDGAVAFPMAADHGCRVTCLDRDQGRLDRITRSTGELSIRTVLGDVNLVPFGDGEFDAAYSRMVLSHQRDWTVSVREMLRVCRPGGIVVFQHISQERFDFCVSTCADDGQRSRLARFNRPHRSRASHAAIRALAASAGAQVVSISPLAHFLANGLVYHASFASDEHTAFVTELRERLRHPAVYEFVSWYERSVTPRLPQEYSEMLLAVLRKPD